MVAIIFLVTAVANLFFIFHNSLLFKGIVGLHVCLSTGNPGKYGNMEIHIIFTAYQEDVEAEVAAVADVAETEFAAEPRDAKVGRGTVRALR